MDKTGITSIILGIIFFLGLIVYAAISLKLAIFLHFVLLILGLSISLLLINKITKSSNSLRSKVYFVLIISLLIFYLILFFWILGAHLGMDEKGLITAIIIFPSTILFAVISFIIGIILSIKRKRKDFDYNINKISLVLTLFLVALLLISFYNPIITNTAKLLGNENVCYLTIHPKSFTLFLFQKDSHFSCMVRVGINQNDEKICDRIDSKGHRNVCYRRVILKKEDIKLCFNSQDAYDVSERCGTVFPKLENKIYTILNNPSDPEIIYAIKATPSLGIYYDKSAENKFIPLIKNIVKKGYLEAKKESLGILFTWANQNSFEESKEILRNEILPLIKDQPELQSYIDKINQKLSAVELKGTTSNIKTPTSK